MTQRVADTACKWWILAAATCAISMIFLDQTVLPVALPKIRMELHVSDIGVEWIINSYLLALTALVLAAGRLGEMFGYRKMFSAGLCVFSVASILCGASQDPMMFILSRALQGVGGAMIVPNAAAIVGAAFPRNQQGRAFGLYVGIGSFFLSLGPLVGGVCAQYLSWRFVFWINLPIAVLGLYLASRYIPLSERKKEKFDYLGFFTLAIGVSCIVVALMEARQWGWSGWRTLTTALIGIGMIVILATVDRKVEDPFIDFSIFRSRAFLGAMSAIFATQFFLMLTVFWAVYFQDILLYPPSVSGLWSMIANSPIILLSALSGHIVDRHGPKIPVLIGFALVGVGLLWFIYLPTPSTIWLLLPVIVPFGCGTPLILIPSFTLVMQAVPSHKRGGAIGLNMTLRQLSATLGMAVFGTIFLTTRRTHFLERLYALPDPPQVEQHTLDQILAGVPRVLETLPANTQEQITAVFRSAYVDGFVDINTLGLAVVCLGCIGTVLLVKKGQYP